jgi:hypothetical protein
MNAQFIRFGEIEIDGARYTEDIVIDCGVELVVAPTEQACALLTKADTASTNAILHLTC